MADLKLAQLEHISQLLIFQIKNVNKHMGKAWYELSWFSFPELRLHTVQLKDDGQSLSDPQWQPVTPEETPFNFSELIAPEVIPLTKKG